MNIITLDFETYFDSDYTLKKMTTEAYVRDPRFSIHGVSVKDGHNHAQWMPGGPNLAPFLRSIDWTRYACLCHHAHFDGLILSHHLGIRPFAWLCSLSMARQQLGNHLSVSLDNVRQHFGMPVKRTPYDKFKGKRWHEIDPATQQEIAEGCCDEVDSIWHLTSRYLAPNFPNELYPWIDNTVRMFTEPKLIGDIDMLAELWRDEFAYKNDLFTRLGLPPAGTKNHPLGSDEKFAELLRQYDIEPWQKAAKNGLKYAFAKTDAFMQQLLVDEDDDVRTLAEARVAIKSTLEQTRATRLGYMASRGSMCVYIAAFGAHTNRDAGGDKLNWQNFTRGSKLGKSIKASPGQLKAVVDKSQIECRILNVFAGQWDVVDRFARKEDPYIGIASQFYGHEVYKPKESDPRKEEMEAKRGTGKQLELSCGYGAGGPTIVHTARKGTYGPPVYLTSEQGEQAKVLYRSTHPAVEVLWRTAGRMIAAIAGTSQPVEWGCVEVRTGEIIGPDGSRLRYPNLYYDTDEREWRYARRNGYTKLYGGKLVENLIQWLAWIAFKQDICRIGRESGLWPSIREHDKGVWVIPDDQYAEPTLQWLIAEMSRPPAWMPDVPLDAEGKLE